MMTSRVIFSLKMILSILITSHFIFTDYINSLTTYIIRPLCYVRFLKTDYAVYHQVATKFGSSKNINKKLCMVGYGVKNEVK